MSDTVSRAEYDALAARFATIQMEAETLRKRKSGIDPNALLTNTVGTLKAHGYNPDHIEHFRQVLIADKLGANAPMHMQMAASQGQAMVRTSELEQQVTNLADMVKQLTTTAALPSEREKLKTLVANKDKYPHLAKAYANNPDKFQAGLQAGTAEDYAKKLEEQYTDVLGPAPKAEAAAAAASVNAETTGQSTNSAGKIASAQSGLLNGNTPVPQSKAKASGAWSKDTFNDIKAQIVADTEKLITPM